MWWHSEWRQLGWLERSSWMVFVLTAVFSILSPPASGQPPAGLQAELIADFNDTEKKFVELAEALSWEQYGWRPMPGVRSVAEVFVHVAAGNVQFPQSAGHAPSSRLPEGLRSLPVWTDPVVPASKADVIEMLRGSFDYARDFIRGIRDEDLNAVVDPSRDSTTYRAFLVQMSGHVHEHLGQQIGYARTNRVTPPWSGGVQ